MTHRFPHNDFAARLHSGAAQNRPSFIAMVIAEWHKLVSDVSRAFARKRIRSAAANSRQIRSHVMALRRTKDEPPD
jgi:hypothetical protein